MSTNDLIVSHRKIKTSSDRSFGLVFAGVFAVIAVWPLVAGGGWRPWAAGLALAFLAAALAAPKMLAPANRVWSRLGLALGHIVAPVVMGIVFALVVVPTGLLMRMLGKDMLRLKWQPGAETYWIARTPPAPAPGSMSRQF